MFAENPPYAGLSSQEKEQKSDLKALFSDISKYWKSFDYVCGWFWKGAHFLERTGGKCAFVATNFSMPRTASSDVLAADSV